VEKPLDKDHYQVIKSFKGGYSFYCNTCNTPKRQTETITKENTKTIITKEKRLMNDSLKITQNNDGSYEMSWDKEDPMWSFMNHLTSAEIQIMIQQAIQEIKNTNDT